eukprot:g11877.t1
MQDQPPATNLLMQPTCEQCWSWCSYSLRPRKASWAPLRKRLRSEDWQYMEQGFNVRADNAYNYASYDSCRGTADFSRVPRSADPSRCCMDDYFAAHHFPTRSRRDNGSLWKDL